jgi:alanine dehydrogenase
LHKEEDAFLNIGIPLEVKNNEYRVGIVPSGVRALAEHGHRVLIQKSAGEGSGISDAEYTAAGAVTAPTAEAVYKESEMLLKVKEPLPQEYKLLQKDQVLFTYLHLAPAPELTRAILEQKIIGIAYETVQLENGTLPLLIPMSEIAGKLSVQIGAHYLEKQNGGSGVLLGGVPGVQPGRVAIIGGGTVGLNAAKIALRMGARVTLLDVNLERLRYLSDILDDRAVLLSSSAHNVEEAVVQADVVIGGVLVPGAKARKLVTREMVSKMRKGSVMVDVAIDQGGCFETSHVTTLENPVFAVDGVIHYCVGNMPGCVARTSTYALTNATIPYALKLADLGYAKALEQDISLRRGLNVFKGKLTNKAVAEAVGMEYSPYEL